jgi:mannobiose 2-epimerase
MSHEFKLKFQCIFRMTLLFLLFFQSRMYARDEPCSANELRYSLKHELLYSWYPYSIDRKYGGFLCDFTYDWKPNGRQDKMIVSQARHVWTASQAAIFFGDSSFRQIARHGFIFLRDYMWDKQYGGFFMLLNRRGKIVKYSYADTKTAYGNAFAIYALSSYYSLTGDSSALRLAKKAFLWLEAHSHDPIYGGYFDQMMRNGSNHLSDKSNLKGIERKKTCWKDYNSSIHLLEAFTELYKVWPDSLLRIRTIEMLTFIRDTMIDKRGFMKLYFEPDWTPVSYCDSSETIQQKNWYYDHVSFGHDVETAYLMLETDHVLVLLDDNTSIIVAKKLVDHALANGWDNLNGGFYDRGYYYNHSDSLIITGYSKIWWTQAEGLNTLLLMWRLYPDENYRQLFCKQWEYINNYLIDRTNGGWYQEGLDFSKEKYKLPKATQWKVNYHNARALMNCIRMLETTEEMAL